MHNHVNIRIQSTIKASGNLNMHDRVYITQEYKGQSADDATHLLQGRRCCIVELVSHPGITISSPEKSIIWACLNDVQLNFIITNLKTIHVVTKTSDMGSTCKKNCATNNDL